MLPRAAATDVVRAKRDFEVAHPTYISLLYLKQKPSEPLWEYIQHVRQMQDKVRNLPAASVIMLFYLNVRNTRLCKELAAHFVHTVAELYALAYWCARMEEARDPSGAGEHGYTAPRSGSAFWPAFGTTATWEAR